jgi:Tfp pilus assembly protein PilF
MLAQSCLWAKQYTCALEEFRHILQRDPDSATAHMLMGRRWMAWQKLPEAIAEFQAAARVSPHEPNVHFDFGYLYWKSRRYDEAQQEFETDCPWISR